MTRNLEIGNTLVFFCSISGDWGELGIPNLARTTLIKCYWMLQNARVIECCKITFSDLLRETTHVRTHTHRSWLNKSLYYFYMIYPSISSFELVFFLFPQNFLLTNSISFSFDHWIFCYSILFASFWLFLILFRMLRMLVTVNNQKHMSYHRPHASRITIQLLPKDFLVCPIKLVWHWSHASWIAIKHLQKTFANPKTQ